MVIVDNNKTILYRKYFATDFNAVRVDKLLPFDGPFPLSSHTPKLYFRSNFNGSWSSKGCSVVNRTKTEITCTCNHLTNFAVLMHVGADNEVSWSSFFGLFSACISEYNNNPRVRTEILRTVKATSFPGFSNNRPGRREPWE